MVADGDQQPWAITDCPWLMRMRWRDLLFRSLAGRRRGPMPFDSQLAGTGSVRRASVCGRRSLTMEGTSPRMVPDVRSAPIS
jgi:hypothetical protein